LLFKLLGSWLDLLRQEAQLLELGDLLARSDPLGVVAQLAADLYRVVARQR
jgi:hypothetical protein